MGVCYGLQEIAWNHGKDVSAGDKKEYGHAVLKITKHANAAPHVDALFDGLGKEMEVCSLVTSFRLVPEANELFRYGCLTGTNSDASQATL